jgi:hypothetical protein
MQSLPLWCQPGGVSVLWCAVVSGVFVEVGMWGTRGRFGRGGGQWVIAGIIYSQEENYVEALKACHSGASLEM